jgi:hypothetical protein
MCASVQKAESVRHRDFFNALRISELTRDELIRRCRGRVAMRGNGSETRAFAVEGTGQGPMIVGGSAKLYGKEMLQAGYSVDQVVHGAMSACRLPKCRLSRIWGYPQRRIPHTQLLPGSCNCRRCHGLLQCWSSVPERGEDAADKKQIKSNTYERIRTISVSHV